ncbi:MAG TPA: translesion error-prone DNA polymerase V autoproteolytic subunit [Syntrophales bacterium]|nr:translesion error-prone DNA polymerase V autoproteolytic subunit [Syntrophales bacterium]
MKVTAIYHPDQTTECSRPLFMVPVSAGFPSPAEDYIEAKLDLNQYLVKNPIATFFVKVSGNSMIDAGIHDGDILIVDRSLKPVNNRVIIAVLNGELTVRRIRITKNSIFLISENKDYKPIQVEEDMGFEVWGVVTNVIHPL